MRVITRDDVFAIKDLVTELVEVPEWGGEVYVRSLTGAERDKFEASLLVGKGTNQTVSLSNLRAKLVAQCCVDGPDAYNAKRIFSDEDVPSLAGKSASALQRVFAVAQKLSHLTAEDVEELTSSLGEDQNGASGSS